jgi:hypothetical protein
MTANSASQDPTYQVAQSAAGEAIDAVLSVFWADSFNLEALESRLVETIHSFIKGARLLEEAHPNPESLEGNGPENVIQFRKR